MGPDDLSYSGSLHILAYMEPIIMVHGRSRYTVHVHVPRCKSVSFCYVYTPSIADVVVVVMVLSPFRDSRWQNAP